MDWRPAGCGHCRGTGYRGRRAIAEVHALNPDNIICSNGSDEVLGLIAQTYLSPGDEAIVEWRALTVALLDQIAEHVRLHLGMDAARLPLGEEGEKNP